MSGNVDYSNVFLCCLLSCLAFSVIVKEISWEFVMVARESRLPSCLLKDRIRIAIVMCRMSFGELTLSLCPYSLIEEVTFDVQ